MNKNTILLSGDELYLIDHYIEDIKNRFIKPFEEMNVFRVENIKKNGSEVVSFLKTIPFMAKKRMVIIEDCSFLTSKQSLEKQDEDELLQYIANKKDENCLIFKGQGLKIDKRKKITKQIEKHGEHKQYNKLREIELVKWIVLYLTKNNREITQKDALWMAHMIGYLEYQSTMNLYDVKNELDKLIGYTENRQKVEEREITMVVNGSVENNIFKLIDNICEGKREDALEMLEDMQTNNIAPQYIFFMIARHLRSLSNIISMREDGVADTLILKKLNMRPFVYKKMTQQIFMMGKTRICKTYETCYLYDRKSKVGELEILSGIEMIIGMI